MLVRNRYLNWAEDHLRETLPERLETWSERLLEASRLEAVFESDIETLQFVLRKSP